MSSDAVFKTYLNDLSAREIMPDPAQTAVLKQLADIHYSLSQRHTKLTHQKIKHHVNKVFGFKQNPIKGLYCWGSVGRGKTLLMDCFYEHLPFRAKNRLHFHDFMQHIHREMHRLQGLKNPLRAIAKDMAKHTHVLCFDEFVVEDVADAMILGELLEQLFHEGITLLATSNTAPEDLYKGGVQRQRFMQAIQNLKAHTDIVHLDTEQDYRLKTLMEAGVYFHPLNESTQEAIKHEFTKLATGLVRYGEDIPIQNRHIPTRAIANDVIWFDFNDICTGARAASDYLEIATHYKTVFITHVPQMSARDDAAAKRFMHLIDVLYDKGIAVVISAAVDVQALYQGKDLKQSFERTQSRLIEMQSRDYLAH